MSDPYARTPGGSKWGTMRGARNLPGEVRTPPHQDEIGRQTDDENRRLRDLSDALSVLAIDQDTDAQETTARITAIWEHLAYPHAAEAPHGGNVERVYFSRMIRAGLWISHGKPYTGIASYFPKLVRDGDMCDIYGVECDFGEPTPPEVANTNAHRKIRGRRRALE